MSRQFLKNKKLAILFLAGCGIISLFFFINGTKPLTKDEYAVKIFDICNNSKDKNSCYLTQFESLTKEKNLFFSSDVVKKLQNLDSQVSFCHNLAHKISITEVSKSSDKWLELLSKVDIDDCSRGYFHGIFEGHMRADNNFEISAKTINDVCTKISQDKVEPERGKILRNCPHAMGHLLLVEKNGDVKAAIDECQEAKDPFKKYCNIGVFMEDSQKDNLEAHGLVKNKNIDQQYLNKTASLCNFYSEEISSACWQSLGEVFGKYFMDPNLVYENCQSANSPGNSETCYLFGVSALSVYLASDRFENFKDLSFCEVYKNNNEKYQKCIISVINYTLNTSGSFKGFLYKFCETINGENKDFCLGKIKSFKQ